MSAIHLQYKKTVLVGHHLLLRDFWHYMIIFMNVYVGIRAAFLLLSLAVKGFLTLRNNITTIVIVKLINVVFNFFILFCGNSAL
jgi:hypothetical protein